MLRLLKLLAAVTGGIALILGAIVWTTAGQVISPPKRALQAYHHEWLSQPEAHGITIEPIACLDEKVPVLIVEPAPSAGPGERGRIVRRQLAERGRQLRPYGEISGNLVLLHGRKGRKEDLLPVAERFCAAGFRCILLDLPAHGESPLSAAKFGSTEFEAAIPQNVLAELGLDGEPCALWGMSMGGAYAVSAARSGQWRTVIVVCSFDRLDTVISEQSRRRLGRVGTVFGAAVRRAMIWRDGPISKSVNPAVWANEVTIPAMVVHGDADRLFATVRGRNLFDGFASLEKTWVPVPGGDHTRILVTPMPLYATMADWFLQRLGSG